MPVYDTASSPFSVESDRPAWARSGEASRRVDTALTHLSRASVRTARAAQGDLNHSVVPLSLSYS